VLAVIQTGLTTRHQHEMRLRRISGLGVSAAPAQAGPSHLSLLREHKGLPEHGETLELPAGASTRSIDQDGRIKLGRELCLSELLGWGPGTVQARCDGPWLVLTQPEGHLGGARTRNGHLAGLTRDAKGVDRLCLPPAHLALLVRGSCRIVFAIPVPASSSLLLADPAVALLAAPASIVAAVTFQPEMNNDN
jgi:hypothetical protein